MLPGSSLLIGSAAIGDWHIGSPAHPRSIAEGERRGYVLDGRARQVEPADFERFELIVGMDAGHVRELRRLQPDESAAEIGLFRDFDPAGARGLGLDDPYNLSPSEYAKMYDVIEPTCAALARSLT